MESLLSMLKTIPEYAALVDTLRDYQPAAVTGIGQINRSHMLAGLHKDLQRPMIVLCQDEMSARSHFYRGAICLAAIGECTAEPYLFVRLCAGTLYPVHVPVLCADFRHRCIQPDECEDVACRVKRRME